ncbi:MAG: glycine cleavage T C-terminal barrel domain-containing protein [Planctomycetota bacterium]|nr:glycine cleavage T C-terminal barrel domain-containing protein [Planctomycetota bacterium]
MSSSPLLPLHVERGARTANAPGGETLLTYGDVPAEYRSAVEAALLLDRGGAGRVSVTGSDATDFLHRITANRVKGVEPGHGNANLLLDGKGKIQEVFDLARTADGFELTTPPDRAPSLIAALDMFLFVDDVQLTDHSDQHAPIDVIGPKADAVVAAALGLEAPALGALVDHAFLPATLGEAAVVVTRRAAVGCPGLRLSTHPDHAPALWDALVAAGAATGGLAIEDILRVEAVRARFGVDIDATVYPQEARLEAAFSLDKGCYIGQEVVAKIDTYGGLNKRLMVLAVDGDEPVRAGTRLERFDEARDEWRDLGIVTSWAYSFSLDRGAVLAYVKRRHQEPGTVFHLVPPGVEPAPDRSGLVTATVAELPLRAGSVLPPEEPDAGVAQA